MHTSNNARMTRPQRTFLFFLFSAAARQLLAAAAQLSEEVLGGAQDVSASYEALVSGCHLLNLAAFISCQQQKLPVQQTLLSPIVRDGNAGRGLSRGGNAEGTLASSAVHL